MTDGQQAPMDNLPQYKIPTTNPMKQTSFLESQQTMTTSLLPNTTKKEKQIITNKQQQQQQEQQQQQQHQQQQQQHQQYNNSVIPNLGEIMENCRSNSTYSNNNSGNHQRDYDEFDAFSNSVAAQMRTLPLDVAYEVQLQIQCLITQTKLKVLGRQTSIIVESNANNSASSRNWNQSNHNNSNSNSNYSSNSCKNEVKMEDDTEQTNNKIEQNNNNNNTNQNNNQNSEITNTPNCYNLRNHLGDPSENSDIEDYLGLE